MDPADEVDDFCHFRPKTANFGSAVNVDKCRWGQRTMQG